ncbi:MAG: hypothetical protein UT33_C0009G0072 [Candidatus Peregrinibacteria bacterium GW2011_GWC2_39_14]|nr:MAG: Cna B domain protein [Candidatus Peregrinibacteria bacterium GW2011_GWA2_38_36]KKR06621.1 MAG: hypothetical protein UT33_C0009G0072 [Candidatus Peregrinibacteria bacterium GW2011_GWC2_39_14]
MAPNKILDDTERKLVTDMAEAKIAEAMEKKDVDAVLLKIGTAPATSPDQLLTIFKSIDTWLSTRAGTDPNEKQKVLAEVYEIIMEQVGRAIIVERKLKGMKDKDIDKKIGELEFAKSEEEKKSLIGEYLWGKGSFEEDPAGTPPVTKAVAEQNQKKKLGEIELKALPEDQKKEIITKALLAGMTKDVKLDSWAAHMMSGAESATSREAMIVEYLMDAYGKSEPLTDLQETFDAAAWSALGFDGQKGKVKERKVGEIMRNRVIQKQTIERILEAKSKPEKEAIIIEQLILEYNSGRRDVTELGLADLSGWTPKSPAQKRGMIRSAVLSGIMGDVASRKNLLYTAALAGTEGLDAEDLIAEDLVAQYNAAPARLSELSTPLNWSALDPSQKEALIRAKKLPSVMSVVATQKNYLVKALEKKKNNDEIDKEVGSILYSIATTDRKAEILGQRKFDELKNEDDRKEIIVKALYEEKASPSDQKKVLLEMKGLSIEKKRKLVADSIWTETLGGKTGAEKTKLIREKLEEAITEAREKASDLSADLDKLITPPLSATLTSELLQQIKNIKTIRDIARKAQENSDKRWEKVKKKGSKYYWHTDLGGKFKAGDKGFEGVALLGELPDARKEVELKGPPTDPTSEVALYILYEARVTTERTKFYALLDSIGGIPIDIERAKHEPSYLPDKARDWFDALTVNPGATPPIDDKKLFAKFEGLLNEDAYDRDKCVAHVLQYLNAAFGKAGRYIELDEVISKEEHLRLLDNLDYAEDIVEELARISGVTFTTRDDYYNFLEDLKENISHAGSKDKAKYFKYLHIRDKLAKNGEDADVMMLHYVEYILQLRSNGITCNPKEEPGKGWKEDKSDIWKTKDYPDEFDRDIVRYREIMGMVREAFPDKKPGELRKTLKSVCENYLTYLPAKGVTASGSEAEKMFNIINDHYKAGVQDALKELYKALMMFEMTPISIKKIKWSETAFSENIPAQEDVKNEDLDKARENYAKSRREIRRWRSRKFNINTERTKYTDIFRQRIAHNASVDPALIAMPFANVAEKDAFKLAMRNKIVGDLLTERKALLAKEVDLQSHSRWEKFKTFWRQHPVARLGISGALLGATGLAVAFAGAPVAIPLIALKAGWLGVNSQVAWEGNWEFMQQRFGATRGRKPFGLTKLHGVDVATMNEEESRKKLAAHTTLTTGKLPGYRGAPTMTPPSAFYGNILAEDVWNKHKEHIDTAVDAALAGMPATATKGEILTKALDTAMAKELEFIHEVEKREQHLRTTDIIKKLSGLVLGALVAGYSLASDLPKTAPTPAPTPGPTPAPTPGPAPVTPPPEPTVVPPPEPVTPGPIPGPIPGPVPGPVPADLTFKMIDSMPGDIDPGVLQAMPFKLGLSGSEASQLHTYMGNHHVLGGMESLNPFVTARPGIPDSYGVFQQGINFVRPDEVFKIPDGGNFVNEVVRITGGRLSPAEIARRLAN